MGIVGRQLNASAALPVRRVVLALGTVDPVVHVQLAGRATVVELSSGTLEQYHGALDTVVGLIVRGHAVVDEAVLNRLPELLVVARTGVGVDNVDLDAATKRGLPVVITPHAGTAAVAEGTMALVLHLVKRLTPLTALVRDGRWSERERSLPGDLEGATLGIVGFGRIGSRVGHLATEFGMRVVVFDPYLGPSDPRLAHVALVDLDELARVSDVVTLHAPLTNESRAIVNAEFLARCKPGMILVNAGAARLSTLTRRTRRWRTGALAESRSTPSTQSRRIIPTCCSAIPPRCSRPMCSACPGAPGCAPASTPPTGYSKCSRGGYRPPSPTLRCTAPGRAPEPRSGRDAPCGG